MVMMRTTQVLVRAGTQYTVGRQLGISGSQLDAFFAAGGTASIDGRTVTLTWTGADGRPHSAAGRSHLGHTRKATRWVNAVNRKADRLAAAAAE